MNRSEMIEKAARASHQWGLDFGGEYAEWDALRELTRREYREEAAAVVEALLPRVTTVEELEALPGKTLLFGTASGQAEPLLWQPLWQDPQEILETFGPLTVVWQP